MLEAAMMTDHLMPQPACPLHSGIPLFRAFFHFGSDGVMLSHAWSIQFGCCTSGRVSSGMSAETHTENLAISQPSATLEGAWATFRALPMEWPRGLGEDQTHAIGKHVEFAGNVQLHMPSPIGSASVFDRELPGLWQGI